MNENINLCEILKGHEGETFYSSLYGNIKLIHINEKYPYPLYFKSHISNNITFSKDGKPDRLGPECLLFPSKDQRDWIKWDKENNHKTPKTWKELKDSYKTKSQYIKITIKGDAVSVIAGTTPIEKSALALLKINQLIEVGYGGNVPIHDRLAVIGNNYYDIDINEKCEFEAHVVALPTSHIVFHTKEQAEEFLSYPENVQLLKDYYMIND